MRNRTYLVALLTGIATLLASPAAHAWGCKGHQTVALIAEKHLTAEAKKLAADALALDPHRPNTGTPCNTGGLDNFAAAATWADGVRIHGTTPNADAGFHFIDVPRGAGSDVIAAICGKPGSCITEALKTQIGILENLHAPDKDRAAAIRYIIHLVGDLHQPLHCTTNGDRGANCVPVTYFRSKPHPNKQTTDDPDDYGPNLHGAWDTLIVEKDMKATGAPTPQAYANALDTEFQTEFPVLEADGINLEDWAMDSHQHAEDVVYGDLPKVIPIDAHPDADVKKCSDNRRIGNRMLHKHLLLGQPYQDEAASVVQERLAMAGIRLAMILNDAATHSH